VNALESLSFRDSLCKTSSGSSGLVSTTLESFKEVALIAMGGDKGHDAVKHVNSALYITDGGKYWIREIAASTVLNSCWRDDHARS
jgi:hypothetical protein